MDYTLSSEYVTHVGTGNRMHEDSQPVPTLMSDKDFNQTIWSLMEIVKAADLEGIQFDPNTPASYTRLLEALNLLYGPSDIGGITYFPATLPPSNRLIAGGFLVLRADYPRLWAYAQASGILVTEAAWAARPGAFSTGNGVTTFRIPQVAGLMIRGYHGGDGTFTTNTTAVLGEYVPDQIKSHTHTYDKATYTAPQTGSSTQCFTGNAAVETAATGGPENNVRHVLLLPTIRYK